MSATARSLLVLLLLCSLAKAQEPAPEDLPAAVGEATAPSVPDPAPAGRVGADELPSLARHDDLGLREVGDVQLRASDVFRMIDLAAPALSADVMREMVLTTCARLEALREGVDVPAPALARGIDEAMAEQRARFASEVDPDTPLEEYLRVQHGMGTEEYRAEVRRMVLSSMLLERAVRLDQHRLDRDELQVMLIDDEDEARQVADLLDQGASFAVLAKQHSVHPSAQDGGFMPSLPAGIPVPLVEGREDLQPGEVLGPAPITVDGKDVWRLVRLVARHAATDAPWSELRDEIEASLESTPVGPDEVAIFEARMRDRYRVHRPERSP